MWISHFIIKHLKIDEFTLQNCAIWAILDYSFNFFPIMNGPIVGNNIHSYTPQWKFSFY